MLAGLFQLVTQGKREKAELLDCKQLMDLIPPQEFFTWNLGMICPLPPHQSFTCPSQHETKSGNRWPQRGMMAFLHGNNG